MRFSLVQIGDTYYAFSVKPNSYIKLNKEEVNELSNYANISKSTRPSDLMLNLCDRGNALPLVFHPLGSKILNERAELLDQNLNPEQRQKAIQVLANSIVTTDKPVTSILIPYPEGTTKYIYITPNDEFAIREGKNESIYHYNEETDTFNIEQKPWFGNCDNEIIER